MIIKKEFTLLHNVKNTLSLSKSAIDQFSVENGPRKIFVMLEMMKQRINHFTKDKIFSLISNIKERETIHVVHMKNYILPISYNEPTKDIIINLASFGVDDIYPNNPGSYNIYACMVYGMTLKSLLNQEIKIDEKYSPVISSYLTSVIIRIFGKSYGLLGSFSTEINKLKFLINCYILEAFFGIKGQESYRKAATYASFDYRKIENKLENQSFSNINEFIASLSTFKIMPGMNRHMFAAKIMKMFSVNFIPALEDCSRFISILTTSNISSSSVVPTYLYKYDERSFNNILEISKRIFKT